MSIISRGEMRSCLIFESYFEKYIDFVDKIDAELLESDERKSMGMFNKIKLLLKLKYNDTLPRIP